MVTKGTTHRQAGRERGQLAKSFFLQNQLSPPRPDPTSSPLPFPSPPSLDYSITAQHSALNKAVQDLVDQAVRNKLAPGLVAAVFDQNDIIASGEAGVASLSDDSRKITLDSIIWPASAAKPLVSLLVLQLVEKDRFDLDSHEQLVQIIPELGKDWPGTKLWKIVDGNDDDGNFKYRDATVGITLRHLLTHSIGAGLQFNDEAGKLFHEEYATGGKTYMHGKMEGWNQPRKWESGEGFSYGLAAEWLGLFVTRKSGGSFREAAQTLLYKPLGLEQDTIEVYRTPKMDAERVEIAAHLPDGSFVPLPPPGFDTPQHEGIPPKGQSVLGNAPFWSGLRTYARVLRCFLNETAPSPGGKPLLSKSLWEEAVSDDFKRRGISIEQNPFMNSSDRTLSTDIDWFSKPVEGGDTTVGWNMLQMAVHRAESPIGFRPGVVEWTGLANTYYFVDRSRNIGAVISSQHFPWADPGMIDLKDNFFKLVFDHVDGKK